MKRNIKRNFIARVHAVGLAQGLQGGPTVVKSYLKDYRILRMPLGPWLLHSGLGTGLTRQYVFHLFCFAVVVVFWLPRLHCLEHNSGFFCLSAPVLFSRKMFGDETDSSEQSKASPEPPVTCKGLELMKVTGGHFRTFTQIRRR